MFFLQMSNLRYIVKRNPCFASLGILYATATICLRSYVMAEGSIQTSVFNTSARSQNQSNKKPIVYRTIENALMSNLGLHSIAYVTAPTIEVGKSLARKIVENKFAACVNVVPQVTSIYEWKGEINEDNEVLLMIKTRTSKIDDLVKFVKGNHPYEVCEVISTIIDNGNPDYLKWVSDTVPEIK